MMSKNLFFKRMKQDLEQRIWLPVVFFIIAFLMMEMPLISGLSRWQNHMDYGERAYEYLMDVFFTPYSVVTFLTIGVAVISALSGFLYIHSAKKLDVYHSIPIKREKLFWQQYIYGVLYYVIPMLVHVIFCVLICAGNGVLEIEVWGQVLGFILVQLFIYLACYATVIVATCLTGNLVISVLGSGILLVYSLLLAALKSSLMNTFFQTYSGYYGMDQGMDIPAFTPFHVIYNMMMEIGNSNADFPMYADYIGHYGKLLLVTIVYTVIALILYKKRPTEVAGKTMAFPITEPVVKTMVVFPMSILSGYFFTGMISNNGDFIWFLIGCIFGFMIMSPLMEIIFRRDMKAVFSHPLQIVFNGVLVIGVVLIFRLDLFGYDTYIPDEDKVESYAISFGQLEVINFPDGNGFNYRLDNMAITENESARKLLEHAAEITRPARTGKMEDSEQEVCYTFLEVKYNLKNGKSVYRNYLVNIMDEQVVQWLGDTYNDMQHKMGVYPILADNWGGNYIGVLIDGAYASKEKFLPKEKMREFIEVYRKDLENLTFEEIMTENPVANLSFALSGPNGISNVLKGEKAAVETYLYGVNAEFGYYGEEYGYKIYPSFTQTLALLEAYDVDVVNEIPIEDISCIRIEDYSLEVNDSDGYYDKVVKLEYTQEKGNLTEIQEILPTMVCNQLDDGFNWQGKIEQYIDIYVTYDYEGMETDRSFSFKKDQVPQFVLADIENGFKEMEEAAP